jgi:Cu-Zn family superoxide dismutase
MRRWGYLIRSSLLGATGVLPACDGQGGGTANEQSGSRVARLESAEQVRARATIVGPGITGEVTLTELKGNLPEPGVEIEAQIRGQGDALRPGPHGLHIHEKGKGACVPPYTAAGGHFDPGPSGNPDPDANHPYHTGDIPNLVVDEKGVGAMAATTSRITLSPGPLSVFDADGSAIILHGEPDQGITGPPGSGVSGGPRVACGVIELTPRD